jgi:signal transduction histidine kinase
VRLRLTALYGLLFLGSGACLLAITYALVHGQLTSLRVLSGTASGGGAGGGTGGQVHASAPLPDGLRFWQDAALHQLLTQSGLALALTSVIALALGWLTAGRILRPLRVMTAATRRISERNLHERLALPGPRDELTELGDTIDRLLGRLDAAFDSQRRFVANASHELRTPVMLTQTLLQVALADPSLTLASLRDACVEVLAACKEQERLIQALLTLAQGQRGLEHRESFDLADVARQVVRARTPEAGSRGLRVHADLGGAPAAGDRPLIEVLAANLVENAIRHNVPAGQVWVTTGCEQDQAVLTVRNSGPHVPADQVARLLQPFQHLDARRGQQHGGLGLGLSIVAAIAAAHAADLTVHPRPDGGLTVQVRLPPRKRDHPRPRPGQNVVGGFYGGGCEPY